MDEGWLKDYRSYEGSFVTAPSPFTSVRDGLDRKDALLMQFCRGEISAEVFAEQLDELLEAAFQAASKHGIHKGETLVRWVQGGSTSLLVHPTPKRYTIGKIHLEGGALLI